MTATLEGGRKTAATKLGLSVEEYEAHLAAGEQWCIGCRAFHPLSAFHRDASRVNGLGRRCRDARQNRLTPDDPVKVRARSKVRTEVRAGRLPHPGDVPCVDCGHEVGQDGDDGRRHEYDHHLGYAPEHELDVVARCSVCHGAAERRRRKPEQLAAVVTAYLDAKGSR